MAFLIVNRRTEGWHSSPITFYGGVIVALCTGLSVGMLSIMHAWMICMNLTTIEFTNAGSNPYRVGLLRNAEQVFGEFDWYWLFPTDPSSITADGFSYPTRGAPKSLGELQPIGTSMA